jgi:hypothetical protein
MKLNPEERRAAEDSIHHWICDIWYPLRKNPRYDISERNTSGYCPLCKLYMSPSTGCHRCPYVQTIGVRCDTSGHAWTRFAYYHTAKNAVRMIKKLQDILEADRAGTL